MYAESWSARRVVDIPIGDMVREWRSWSEEQSAVADQEERLKVKEVVKTALIGARVTGGAAIYIGQQNISDEQLREPLDMSTISDKDVAYLTPLDRTVLTVLERDTNPMSPRYNRGTVYSINRGLSVSQSVHYSRFIWFDGVFIPPTLAEMQDGWYDSVFNGLEPLIMATDSAIQELRDLLPESRVDIFGIEDLDSYFETSEDESRLLRRVSMTARMKSSQQALVIDKNDDYTQKTMTYSGLTDAVQMILQTLAGAVDVPVTRFLGISPGGLNSTGENDIRNYYDGIAARQRNDLTRELNPLDNLLLQLSGLTGKKPDYEWRSLWQLTEAEKAKAASGIAETIGKLSASGTLDPLFLSELAKQMMLNSPAFTGINAALDAYNDDDISFGETDEI